MSTGEISVEDDITSKIEVMDSSVNDMKEAKNELEIVYSNIKEDTNKPEKNESVVLIEDSLEKKFEEEMTTDRLDTTVANDISKENVVFENTETILSDENDEVEHLRIIETNNITAQLEKNDTAKSMNLMESTFGLIPQDNEIKRVTPSAQSLKNPQSKVQKDVSLEKDMMEQDDQMDETSQMNIEKNMLPGWKKDATAKVEIKKPVNSLSFLAAEYASSESEEEEGREERIPSPCEIITIVDDSAYNMQSKTQYRSKTTVNESESENTDSDSDSSSESDTSDSDSDTETDSDVEDGPDNVAKSQPSKTKKTKSEFEDLPPIEELKITVPEELCDRLGEVSGIVEQLVIVRPISGKPTLNLDSILFLEKGHKVLGQVFDVFGQVADPHYCVRFNSEDHIKKSGIVVGMEVYYSPTTEHTSLVFLHELVKLKGIDVSGEDDIEPPEFSDDEEERAYNQLQRQKQRQKPGNNDKQDNSDAEGLLQKRQCPDRQRNPWSSDRNSYNYNNSRSNRNFHRTQGPPRWNAENPQSSFQNPFNSQNQTPLNHYGPPNAFNPPQYPFNLYNNPYPQNNAFPPQNPRYAFGRPPGFRPDFNNYGPNLFRPNPYPTPSMSWAPPPPPPPPPSM